MINHKNNIFQCHDHRSLYLYSNTTWCILSDYDKWQQFANLYYIPSKYQTCILWLHKATDLWLRSVTITFGMSLNIEVVYVKGRQVKWTARACVLAAPPTKKQQNDPTFSLCLRNTVGVVIVQFQKWH